MRAIALVFLVAFVASVAALAAQNQQEVSLTFFQWTWTPPMALVLGGTFLLGMFAGSTLVAMVRRSFNRLTEDPADRRQAAAR